MRLYGVMLLLLLAPTSALAAGWSWENKEEARRPYTLGGYILAGVTDSGNVDRIPASAYPHSSDTDGIGEGVGAGVSLGYRMDRWKRVPLTFELASTWRYRHDTNLKFEFNNIHYGARLDSMTFDTMASVLWHIPTGRRFTPYVGGGGGVTYIHTQNYFNAVIDRGSTSEVNPSWQLQTGGHYKLSDRLDLRLDYRYIDMGEIESVVFPSLLTGDKFKANLTSHDLRIGAVWKF
jgi:opacity protein-like surface antigen